MWSEYLQEALSTYNTVLNHLFPMHPFSTPWKHQKTLRFCFEKICSDNTLLANRHQKEIDLLIFVRLVLIFMLLWVFLGKYSVGQVRPRKCSARNHCCIALSLHRINVGYLTPMILQSMAINYHHILWKIRS